MKHIDEFTIHRFRGMREARFESLGQINLLVGGNNSGKTSALEALSIFCDPLNPRKWSSTSSARDTGSLDWSLSDRVLWLFPQEGSFPHEDLFPHEELFPQEGNVSKVKSEGNSDAVLLLSASGQYSLKELSARYERFSEVIKDRIPRFIVGEESGQRDDFGFEERERSRWCESWNRCLSTK